MDRDISSDASDKSSASILSGSVPISAAEQPLRPSKIRPRPERNVVLLTEVMVEPGGFKRKQKERTITYEPEKPLFPSRFPAICRELEGGVIIDLGITNVRE